MSSGELHEYNAPHSLGYNLVNARTKYLMVPFPDDHNTNFSYKDSLFSDLINTPIDSFYVGVNNLIKI